MKKRGHVSSWTVRDGKKGPIVLPAKPSVRNQRERARAARALRVSTAAEKAAPPVAHRPNRLVQSLSSVLLDQPRLAATQRLLFDAHSVGLTLQRLMMLLGIHVVTDGPGCATLPAHPNLAPGWGCCACAKAHPEKMGTYNSVARLSCRVCGHERCVP